MTNKRLSAIKSKMIDYLIVIYSLAMTILVAYTLSRLSTILI